MISTAARCGNWRENTDVGHRGIVCAIFVLEAGERIGCTPGTETVPSTSGHGCACALCGLFCPSPESSRSVFLPLFDQADRRALFQAGCSNPCERALPAE